jgi:hypothetical protein
MPGDVIAATEDGENSMAVARMACVHIDVAIPDIETGKSWQISDPHARNDAYDALRQEELDAQFQLKHLPPKASRSGAVWQMRSSTSTTSCLRIRSNQPGIP